MSTNSSVAERLARRGLGATAIGLGSLTTFAGAFGQTAPNPGSEVETVNVTARRTQVDKLPEEIRNTPQSIDVIPLEVMQQQGTTSLQQALRNVPGITLNAGEGGAHGDTVNLRGFSASDDFFLDGLRDTGYYDRDPFNLQAVEVYKGPASTLFGRGSTGGVINQVSKTPDLYPIDEAVLTGGTSDFLRATADVNYVLGDLSALRINAMGERANVADRNDVLNQRYGFAPSVAFGIGKPTTLTISYFHQDEDNIPDYGIPFLSGKVAPVPRDSYFGLVKDDRTVTRVDIGTAHFTHEFNDDLSFQDSLRYGNYWFDFRVTAPHYGGGAGEPPAPVPGQALDTIEVLRDRPSVQGAETTLMNESDLTYKFETGSLAHTLVTGVEFDRETDDLNRLSNQIDQIAPTPLLDPNPQEAFPGRQAHINSRPDTTANTIGLYALDTINFGPSWSMVGALRFDGFDVKYTQPLPPAAHFHHTDNEWNPRAAMVYKPTDTQTYYLSYGTSFNPSAENLSLSARNADLAPEKDRTFELGAKTQWLGGLLAVTAAVFNTEMLNARVGDPDDPLLQTLAGKEEVNGLELGATGHLTEDWEITAGYIYIDPRTVSSTDATQVSQMLPNTAHNQANLWLTYDSPDDWQAGTGFNYLGKRFADPQNTASVPAYITWDAMVGYKFDDYVSLQLNGYNLTNKLFYANLYWSSVTENHAVPGAGRTFTVTAKLEFLTMLVRIPNVLTADELGTCRVRLSAAQWIDGRATAGYQSARVKENLQLAEDSADARELGQIVIGALERSPLFMTSALPRHVLPPLFNRYEPGMAFAAHVDNSIRQVGRTLLRARTDVSATLFLSDPSEYDGGELLIEDTYGAHSAKLPAGDMIVYPATSLHRVAPVTRGARNAAFFWVQSMVKDDANRALLFDLDRSIVELSQFVPDNPALVRLTACYHNLMRRWAEM